MAGNSVMTTVETTYISNPLSDKHVYISHGSAGPGKTEETIAQILINEGINVTILNYFAAYNISKLYWFDSPRYTDDHDVSLADIINLDFSYGVRKFHIGFSLGGYIGLANSDKFIKNYCFYPGCLPLPARLELFDFSNTKIYIGANDNWCNQGIESFLTVASGEIGVNYIPNCFHSFMSIDKSLNTQVIRFHVTDHFLDRPTLAEIKFNIATLKNIFKWDLIDITLQSDPIVFAQCLDEIVQNIKSY